MPYLCWSINNVSAGNLFLYWWSAVQLVTAVWTCSACFSICSDWWNPPHVVSPSPSESISSLPFVLKRACEGNNKSPAESSGTLGSNDLFVPSEHPIKVSVKAYTGRNETTAISSHRRRRWRGAGEQSGRWAEFSKQQSCWCCCPVAAYRKQHQLMHIAEDKMHP